MDKLKTEFSEVVNYIKDAFTFFRESLIAHLDSLVSK